ncbi:hypothetical protein TWF102_000582 [Orbilia oligospora]|uniref:Uncharacterized protein n=1 Tax=Orbilia oligospora TaxID=2813651 RepID=A0A7C8J2A9_ORBOL|nr:hypothetical protein TWF102_000582 [Orbilia oligospora]KAF3083908.1 hypothetical protein TWF706_001055 [Orbilia oligospora]
MSYAHISAEKAVKYHAIMSTDKNVLLPVKLDAFMLNRETCNGGPEDAKIAAITQPNYTFLRPRDYIVQNDIIDHVDLHNLTPAEINPRVKDLGTGAWRENRLGIYLHWILPRPYRSGVARDPEADKSLPKPKPPENPNDPKDPKEPDQPKPNPHQPNPDHAAPTFLEAPNRWLVIRRLKRKVPADADLPDVQAWVVEGDRLRNIDNLPADIDLQVDVSPFITSSVNLAEVQDLKKISIEQQAEIFIGYKEDATTWSEDLEKKYPRVRLSILNSTNQLFPDFQSHCGNVFSLLDTFQYGPKGSNYLSEAAADYYVFGWHSDPARDPFADTQRKRRDILASLNMMLNDDKNDGWLDAAVRSNTLCHGALYNVEWAREKNPENFTVPANKTSQTLMKKMPVSIGVTPMDALLAYVEAQNPNDEPTELEKDLYCLRRLLRAQDESVDSQLKIEDEVHTYNYAHFHGGARYYYPQADTKAPKQPTDLEIAALRDVNGIQQLTDLLGRRMKQLQSQLFAQWWRFITDYKNKKGEHNDTYIKDVTAIRKEYYTLKNYIKPLATALAKRKEDLELKELTTAVYPEFHQQMNPDIFISGIDSGWAHDFLKKLRIRLDGQTLGIPAAQTLTQGIVGDYKLNKLPGYLQDSATALIQEFLVLAPDQQDAPPKEGTFPPLYHDQGDPEENSGDDDKDPPEPPEPKAWRDRWGSTQGWFPLFLEWEVEYVHIPYQHWKLDTMKARLSPLDKTRFGIPDDLAGVKVQDRRMLSGRVLLLPQPSFSLKGQIERLISSVPKETLDKDLPEAKRTRLLNRIYELPFLSAPLAGFTEHLRTNSCGTHIKPTVRLPGYELVPMRDARLAALGAQITDDDLVLMGTESDLTPYGFSVPVPQNGYSAFKPVIHGQARFTKINIIDKFGQAIHAVNPEYTGEKKPIHPYIGEFYEPQLKEDKKSPNVVDRELSVEGTETPEDEPTEYFQLPPQINQPARLNAAFVTYNSGDQFWQPTPEWKSPVWGWLVVNYVDSGLQLFLPDGTFYREVRLTAFNNGDANETTWLPFKPPAQSPPNTGPLDELLARLRNQDYLNSFIGMINTALSNQTSSTPSAYSQYVNCLVGRPLALVTAAWSLELAEDENRNQSTFQPDSEIKNRERTLLSGDKKPLNNQYQFPIKLGDKSRISDGMIGYFKAKGDNPQEGSFYNLDEIYSYFPPSSQGSKSPVIPITTENYPRVRAFWQNPQNYFDPGKKDPVKCQEFIKDRCMQYKDNVFGAIIDPFLPFNAYSGLLPTESLKLLPWIWESALVKMTAFFHFGAVIIPKNVPDFQEDCELGYQYNLDPAKKDPQKVKDSIDLPALDIAEWNWLQPYNYNDPKTKLDRQAFMAVGINRVDSKPKFEKGPYTAVEGYLQMKSTIVKDKGK